MASWWFWYPRSRAIQVSKIHLTFSGRIPKKAPLPETNPPIFRSKLAVSFREFLSPKSSPTKTPSSLTPWCLEFPCQPFVWCSTCEEVLRVKMTRGCFVQKLPSTKSINWHQLPLDPKRLKNEDFRRGYYGLLPLKVKVVGSHGIGQNKTNSTYHFFRLPSVTCFPVLLGPYRRPSVDRTLRLFKVFHEQILEWFSQGQGCHATLKGKLESKVFLSKPQIICLISGTGI